MKFILPTSIRSNAVFHGARAARSAGQLTVVLTSRPPFSASGRDSPSESIRRDAGCGDRDGRAPQSSNPMKPPITPFHAIWSRCAAIFTTLLLGSLPALCAESAPSTPSFPSNAPAAPAVDNAYTPPFDAAKAGLTPLFDGKTLNGWVGDPECWKVVDGAIVGVKGNQNIMTVGDYDDFRIILSTRQVKAPDNHQGVGFWGEHMPAGKYGYGNCVDVMPPMNWTWDYTVNKGAPGKLSISKDLGLKRSDWTQAEILVNRARGTIRMAVNGVEMLYYTDDNPSRLKKGPIGLQAHAGNQDVRYKDIFIEVAPKEDRLITVKQ